MKEITFSNKYLKFEIPAGAGTLESSFQGLTDAKITFNKVPYRLMDCFAGLRSKRGTCPVKSKPRLLYLQKEDGPILKREQAAM